MRIILLLWSVLFVAAETAYSTGRHYDEIMMLFRIVHLIMVYKLIVLISDKRIESRLSKIATASFFIYVFHEPWMGYIVQIAVTTLKPESFFACAMPLLMVILTIYFSYTAYLICLRVCPRFLNIIIGLRLR